MIKKGNYKAVYRQAKKIEKIRKAEASEACCCGLTLRIDPGVYSMAGDSELMIETVEISPLENFLEIGCGTGVVSISLARRAESGVGADINDLAVENSLYNARKFNVKNIKFLKSDVFENINEKFNVIVCNPPYSNHEIRDNVDRMFWDPGDEMKKKFFQEVGNYLKPGGRVYFGWANFNDIDVDLPLNLAEENDFELVNVSKKSHTRGDAVFFVIEFKKRITAQMR